MTTHELDKKRVELGVYSVGFGLSLILTLISFLIVINHSLSGASLIIILAMAAFAQLFVQLYFFLHLGQDAKPRWRVLLFLFAGTIVAIVFLGSLWITQNLNYHHKSAAEMDSYMQSENKKGF